MMTGLFFICMFVEELIAAHPEVRWILLAVVALIGGIMIGYHMHERGEQYLKDREGAKQVTEIRNMISTHKSNLYQDDVSSYEELLKEVTLK